MTDEKKPISLRKLSQGASIPLPGSNAPKPTFQQASQRGTPVRGSRDLDRIVALDHRPVLDLKSTRAEALVQLMTERYSNGVPANGGCRCKQIRPRRPCVTTLLPLQAWALYEAGLAKGLLGFLPVGAGKTILDLLLIFPLDVDKALALVPSNLVTQLWTDYQLLSQHFTVPSISIEGLNKSMVQRGQPMLYVQAYGAISRPGNTDYIDKLKPKAVISDECDKLADLEGSATARRAFRFAVENPDSLFCGLTGSPGDKEIGEFAHLAAWALKDNSPVPLDPKEVEQWGTAIDVSEMPSPAGALRALCLDGDTSTAGVRRGFFNRLSETLGVIIASSNDVEVSDENGIIANTVIDNTVKERPAPTLPPLIVKALELARGFKRPDTLLGAPMDEELETPIERARTIAEVVSGVMNVWEFPPISPDGKKFLSIAKGGRYQEAKVIDEVWYPARAAYNKAVRAKCIEGAQFLDSPKLCEDAARRYWGDIPDASEFKTVEEFEKWKNGPVWPCPEYPDWRDVRGQVKPMPVAKRLHPYLVEDAAKWALENRGIVWYDLVEFGQWVAELSGLPLHGGGPKALARISAEDGSRSIIASIESHGRGRDGLQDLFAQQLVAQSPSSARRFQQLLGRLIRRGQRSFEVFTWIYLHIPELRTALDQALKRGSFAEEALGMKQQLLKGWLRSR